VVGLEQQTTKGHHIVTVGTSIFTNISRIEGSSDGPRQAAMWSFQPENLERVTKVLLEDPRSYSAELNAMWDYLEGGNVAEVSLFTTDTDRGKFCGRILENYFIRAREIQPDVIHVPNFGTEDFDEGIRNLRNRLTRKIRDLRKKKPHLQVYLNATGGFKPETAMMVYVASLFRVPAYYTYETFRRTIEIPPLPVGPGARETCALLEEIPPRGIVEIAEQVALRARNPDLFDYCIQTGLLKRRTPRTPSGEAREILELTSLGKLYLELSQSPAEDGD